MENEEISKEMDQVKADITKLRGDMASLLETLKNSGVEQGREYYDRAYERARRTGETVRDRAGEAYAAIGKEIEEYPLTSVLAAFVTGFVVGMVLDRRR
jgi:ElaB/YqjD/DUF883 family membrane-anchored ribosome-binding protein